MGPELALGAGGRSGVALRRAHSCRDELPSLQVRLSPDPPDSPDTWTSLRGLSHGGREKEKLSFPTKTPSPVPRLQHFNSVAGPGPPTRQQSACSPPIPQRLLFSFPRFGADLHRQALARCSPRVCSNHFHPCYPRRSWYCIPARESESPCGVSKGLGRAQIVPQIGSHPIIGTMIF